MIFEHYLTLTLQCSILARCLYTILQANRIRGQLNPYLILLLYAQFVQVVALGLMGCFWWQGVVLVHIYYEVGVRFNFYETALHEHF